jgi:hypothetical protein
MFFEGREIIRPASGTRVIHIGIELLLPLITDHGRHPSFPPPSSVRIALRARERRDITVPVGIPKA